MLEKSPIVIAIINKSISQVSFQFNRATKSPAQNFNFVKSCFLFA